MLDRHILHRDQIWFMEKKNKSTILYPLKDFKVDEKEARQKRYLDGRYGGVPIIVEGFHGETSAIDGDQNGG